MDESQKFAIEFSTEKSLFLTAPPGYGKTHVITERIKYLISNGHVKPPEKILALTFSNSAANEMIERVNKNIPRSNRYVDIMNFHTFAYLILRNYGHHIDIDRNFTIIDELNEYEFKKHFFETKDCIKKAFDDQNWIDNYGTWFSQKYLGDMEPEERRECYDELLFEELKEKIGKELIKKDELNFDYLLFKCLELLRNFPVIKDIIFDKYNFILADEFQDTNDIQYSLLKEIAIDSKTNKKPLFIVGDEKQSIMQFQGANPKNIKRIIEDFECDRHELKINHRTSSNRIKDITARLRYSKEVDSKFKMYVAIKTRAEESISKINSCLVTKIEELVEKGIKLHDICILFPQESVSSNIKEKLKENGIEFISVTDYSFKSISNKYSQLFKVVKELIYQKCEENSVNNIIETTIEEYYPDKKDNIILNTIKNFSYKFDGREYLSLKTWQRLQEFYNHLKMDIDWSKVIRTRTKNKIFLSTIHSAKGLEFKFIFMIGIVNYQLPHRTLCVPPDLCNHSRNINNLDISEYKDLFYVGVSRSIEDIFFFFNNKEINYSGNQVGRKISCVFRDVYDLLTFIDADTGKEYSHEDGKIKRNCCGRK